MILIKDEETITCNLNAFATDCGDAPAAAKAFCIKAAFAKAIRSRHPAFIAFFKAVAMPASEAEVQF